MTVQELEEILRQYPAKAKVQFNVGPKQEIHLLSDYGNKEYPNKSTVCHIDLGDE